MSASFWLRAAAAVALVQIAAHAWLFFTAAPSHGPAEAALVAQMRALEWSFAGNPRSYWDFYFGYGTMGVVAGVVQGLLFWLLAGPAARDPAGLRPVIGLYLAAILVHAGLAWTFFFPLPALFDLTVAALLGIALLRSFARPAAAT